MDTSDADKPGQAEKREDGSFLRERLARDEVLHGENSSPDAGAEQRGERMALLTRAETREYSVPPLRKRMAEGIDSASRQASRATGRSLARLLLSVLKAMRAAGAALVAGLSAVGAAFMAALRAIGKGLVAGVRGTGRAFARLLLSVLRALRAMGPALLAGVRGTGRASSVALRGAGSGLAGASRTAKVFAWPTLTEISQRAWEHRGKLAVGALLSLLLLYGVIALRQVAPEALQTARSLKQGASEPLVKTGATLHLYAELLGLVDGPLTQQAEPARAAEKPGPKRYLLKVVTEPAGARVSVGGERFLAPGEIELDRPEGKLRVSVYKRAYRAVRRNLTVDDFQPEGTFMTHSLSLRLKRAGPDPVGSPEKASGKKAADEDTRPKIWLEPLPPRPKPEGSPSVARAEGGQPTADKALSPSAAKAPSPSTAEAPSPTAASLQPAIWLEPMPTKPAPASAPTRD